MSLLVQANPPVIRVTDTDGHVVMDSADKLFYASDRLQGIYTVPAILTPFNRQIIQQIGVCHPSSTFVRGVMRITGTAGINVIGGAPVTGWFNVGGTYVHTQSSSMCQTLSIIASGGVVSIYDYAHAELLQNSSGQTYSAMGFTVQYDLFIGGFI